MQSKHLPAKRRLKQALDYVSRHWFPLNRSAFLQIQKKLSEGAYHDDHDRLIADLKSDFALYTHCLKKLRELGHENQNPVEGLRKLPFNELKNILLVSEHEISKHDVAGAERGQALRLKYTVLSASTAELVANANSKDSDLAFTCAVIRQLGLNLIAWNYPSIYQRAMSMVRAGTMTFDEALTDNLGFSPSELADHIILGSAVDPAIRRAAGVLDAVNNGTEGAAPSADDHDLVSICEISEAFAQLNDPEHYPQISRNVDTVISQLDQHLGEGGTDQIMGLVNQKFGDYITYIPDVFRADQALQSTLQKVSTEYTNKLFEQNTYAQRCPDRIKDQIREVYRHVSRGQVSSMGVGSLVNRVIPMAGFTQGCVYLLDSRTETLIPKLRIGKSPVTRYRPVTATSAGSDSIIIMEALYATTPMKQEGFFIFGDVVSLMVGPLGSKEPIGVLYLEMADNLLVKDSHEVLNLFRAVRQCLNDCLNV